MDSITQVVLGAAIDETMLGKKIGNKGVLVGAIVATIPVFSRMHHFVATSFLLLLLLSCQFSIAQLPDILKKTNHDIEGVQFKSPLSSDSLSWALIIDDDKVLIDTTIFLGFDSTEVRNSHQHHFFSYYSEHISSPLHSGDQNWAVLSFVVGSDGELLAINVIEDVKGRFGQEEWELTIDSSEYFDVIDNSVVEYIVKIEDICYCVPIIERNWFAKQGRSVAWDAE